MSKLLAGSRILVVEDESLIIFLIEEILTDAGCTSVSTAATAAQAAALIETNAFDVAMLDMNLNGGNSYALADALGAAGVPFVFCTGNSARDIAGPHSERPILRKPFTDSQLVQVLVRLIAGRSKPATPEKTDGIEISRS